MRIHHIALWTPDLGRLKNFYLTHFPARAGEKYENPTKGYASYFLYFDDGASIEIMQRADIPASPVDPLAQAVRLYPSFARGWLGGGGGSARSRRSYPRVTRWWMAPAAPGMATTRRSSWIPTATGWS